MSTATKAKLEVHIRWMLAKDMDSVLGIERDSFADPWEESDFIEQLSQYSCIGQTAMLYGQVAGYFIYELHKTRLHILNFAVAKNVRRQGVGRQMANKLIGKLSANRRTRLSLEVADFNLDAQLFWRAMGFKATSVLRGFYDDSDADAYLMQYTHGQQPRQEP